VSTAVRTHNALRSVHDGARSEAAAKRTQPPAPKLRLVTVPRRRRTARAAAAAFGVLFLLMLGVVAFQTQLAENQLELDRIDQRMELEQERTRTLRRDNAALRSPDRIAAQALAQGLVPTHTRDFLVVPAEVVAAVSVTAGDTLDDVITRDRDALRDYAETKPLVTGEGE
jgi:cell division protein FtsL